MGQPGGKLPQLNKNSQSIQKQKQVRRMWHFLAFGDGKIIPLPPMQIKLGLKKIYVKVMDT
jgi:hypothetical protein